MADEHPIDDGVILFVYGTLMRGQTNAHLLNGAHFIGPAKTKPGYRLHDMGWYPAMVLGGSGIVSGELYQVSKADLIHLDRYEGCPELYERGLVSLADGTSSGSYLLRPDRLGNAPPISSGEWVSYCSAQAPHESGR